MHVQKVFTYSIIYLFILLLFNYLFVNINSLKAESDRIHREYKSSQMLLEKARQSMEDERKIFDQSIRKLEERLRELTLIKEESLMKVKTVQDMNTDLRLTIDKLRTQVIF